MMLGVKGKGGFVPYQPNGPNQKNFSARDNFPYALHLLFMIMFSLVQALEALKVSGFMTFWCPLDFNCLLLCFV